MAHNNHIVDGFNKDVSPLFGIEDAKIEYLKLAETWEDPYGLPKITKHEGIRVVRDDFLVGSKVRGGDCLISSLPPIFFELKLNSFQDVFHHHVIWQLPHIFVF